MKETIEGAIVERFQAAPELAFVDGGCTYADSPDFKLGLDPKLYVAFIENGGVVWHHSRSGTLIARSVEYRFLCHSENHIDGKRMRIALAKVFGFAAIQADPLVCSEGTCTISLPRGSGADLREFVDARGKKIVLHFIDFQFTIDLNLTP